MWGFLAPFIGKIIGALALIAGLLAVYFGIKRKGTLEERAKWEASTAEAKVELAEKVLEATSKDAEIDARTAIEKAAIREANKPKTPAKGEADDIFKF